MRASIEITIGESHDMPATQRETHFMDAKQDVRRAVPTDGLSRVTKSAIHCAQTPSSYAPGKGEAALCW